MLFFPLSFDECNAEDTEGNLLIVGYLEKFGSFSIVNWCLLSCGVVLLGRGSSNSAEREEEEEGKLVAASTAALTTHH